LKHKIIIAENLYGMAGKQYGSPAAGPYRVDTVKNNGQRLMRMCKQYKL
jgi:hypothetical protein